MLIILKRIYISYIYIHYPSIVTDPKYIILIFSFCNLQQVNQSITNCKNIKVNMKKIGRKKNRACKKVNKKEKANKDTFVCFI